MELVDWLREWLENPPASPRCFFMHGPPGSGKTTSVYRAAEKLGMEVAEYNASDDRGREFAERLAVALREKPFVPTVFLLDEADPGLVKALWEDLSHSRNPVVLTANEYMNTPCYAKRMAARASVIAKLVRKGGKPMFDYRQASNPLTDGYRHRLSDFDGWQEGSHYRVTRSLLATVLDSAAAQLQGYKLYLLVMCAVAADRAGRREVLDSCRVRLRRVDRWNKKTA